MNAVEALQVAQAAGIQVTVDKDDLVLSAPAEPPAEVLSLLASQKATIIMLLRPEPDGWSGKDWQEFFGERASNAEFAGGLPPDQAEARAFSCCVGEWLHQNPISSEPGRCDYCQLTDGVLLPYLTAYSISDPGHTWLHQECSRVWHQARRAKALEALGVLLPYDLKKNHFVNSLRGLGTRPDSAIQLTENLDFN